MLKLTSSAGTIPGFRRDDNRLRTFPLLASFLGLWDECRSSFSQCRTHLLGLEVALGLLTTFGRRTISRGICARGGQFEDWSASYRFFSRDRWVPLTLQHQILVSSSAYLAPEDALVVALDDTHRDKTGKKIPSAQFFIDQKPPRWSKHFSWSLRFISMSVLLTPYGIMGPARGVPIRFDLAPAVPKPGKKATDEEKKEYRYLSSIWTLTTQASEQLHVLRAEIDGEESLRDRLLVVVADSTYCNRTIISKLPQRTVLVARTRKDLKLFAVPSPPEPGTKGRRRKYGEPLPTPEQLRKDESIPWQSTQVFAAGTWHDVQYKTVAPVLWKSCGADARFRLIAIRPLGYRLTKMSKKLYRLPAYLLVSDPDYPVHLALQHYFHRWEIEVNHHEEKGILGAGQAQVWHPLSVSRDPAFGAFLYSALLLSSWKAYGPGRGNGYPPQPKWRNDRRLRPSMLDIINQFRRELWLYESGQDNIAFPAGLDPYRNRSKYNDIAQRWLAETVPRGMSVAEKSAQMFSFA